MHRNSLIKKLYHYPLYSDTCFRDRSRMLSFVQNHKNCFDRSFEVGHITASAWIVDHDRNKVLLTHHRKLDLWLQLGGHSDGCSDSLAVAEREAYEESGLATITAVKPDIFDLDIHHFPRRGTAAAHKHYDVRFRFEADSRAPLSVSEESHDLAWIDLNKVHHYNADSSLMRMVDKTEKCFKF